MFLLLLVPWLTVGCASNARTVAPAEPVVAGDFDNLWAAAEDAARDLHFKPDLQDKRRGVLVTEPMIAAQPTEILFRHELSTMDDMARSATATYRRTVRFDFEETDAGFVAKPIVRVERLSLAERRITDPAFHRDFFRRGDERGTPESDRGVFLPRQYWYDVGRDENLERRLADMVRRRL